ncbi:hypothetical protein CLV56_1531 [Mumia flava]|uniref:Uncharacterized protein n=1 Tax=Mumia flava TaxID=1348852 RepID=A0A2M9BHB8_9ACTN|nr:hypothetical protein [Mumia flava]PJJ57304.1 hypothetical protein CLV56_1531 [Mumia flava]
MEQPTQEPRGTTTATVGLALASGAGLLALAAPLVGIPAAAGPYVAAGLLVSIVAGVVVLTVAHRGRGNVWVPLGAAFLLLATNLTAPVSLIVTASPSALVEPMLTAWVATTCLGALALLGLSGLAARHDAGFDVADDDREAADIEAVADEGAADAIVLADDEAAADATVAAEPVAVAAAPSDERDATPDEVDLTDVDLAELEERTIAWTPAGDDPYRTAA